jgi:periplasmic protein TonB
MTMDNTTDRRVPGDRRVDVLRFPPQEKVWWTTTVSRFLVIPTTVTVILATGVYWIHRLPAGEPPADEARGSIQVRLLAAPKLLPVIAHEEGNAPAQQHAPIARILAPNADDLGADLSPIPPTPKIDAAEAFPVPESAALLSQSLPSDAVTRFQQILLRRLALVRQYPLAARQARLQGTVQIAFVMRRDGKVLDAWIGASSGAKILDQEAIDMVWRARPLPAVPAGLPDPLSLKLPVAFTLPP